jgi:hypothetical protein
MTVRIGRLSWKYEWLVYRLALLHVGIMTQNLYLVCTAMRLAPCAVGSVSITVAARALGTDWRAEPCVGQFVVGRQPSSPGGARPAGRDVNDADWACRARAELDNRDDQDG